MKMTVIPILNDALGTIFKGLLRELDEMEIGGRTEPIQLTTLLRSARILRGVLEPGGDFLALKLK